MAISRTGKLNKRLTFEKRNGYTAGVNGQQIPKWESVFSCWFGNKQKFIKEVKNEIGTVFENTRTIVIRQKQKQEVQSDWRLIIDKDPFEIIEINPDVEHEAFQVLIIKKVS